MCFSAPLELRNSRLISTMILSFHFMTRRGFSVTTATGVASRFSLFAMARKASTFSFSTTTAILSCDSLIASSVPSRPSYFFGTALRLIDKPSASSPIATETPPAPKSLQRLIIWQASLFLKSLWSFLSSGAFPFWTSAPQVSTEWALWALEEPVAPPTPSLPVLPPRRMTTSPSTGRSRLTFSAGVAAMTAPISIRFATYPG